MNTKSAGFGGAVTMLLVSLGIFIGIVMLVDFRLFGSKMSSLEDAASERADRLSYLSKDERINMIKQIRSDSSNKL